VRVIAITSGKGGVGKTNIAVNLAIALRNRGHRVLVIDADLGMANVDILLGATSRKHLLDLIRPEVSLEDVIVETQHGLQYISGGSGIEKALEYDHAEKVLLQQKLADCAARADIILVDTGAGLGRNVMDFILAADEVLLVTTPEPTSLTDAYAVMKAYSIYASQKNLRLIINRVYEVKESREVAQKLQRAAEKFLHMPVDCLGYVFEDTSVTKAVRRQTPLLNAEPNTAAARCIDALAEALITGNEMHVKRGWKGFLQQIFKFST
jgi:flagellar synthesis regulator fleN